MTDREIAETLATATVTEQKARAHYMSSVGDLPERDASLVVVRHATALKRSLEQWISARAMRAALVK